MIGDSTRQTPVASEGVSLADEARRMRRRLIAHIESGGSTDLVDSSLEVPAAVYTDPARFAAERRAIFGRLPLLAGLSGDVPKPGDLLRLDAAGTDVLIVRGRDGALRAFLNTCRHRGARLVTDCAPRQRISCPFHNWSYDLDGRLIGVPVAQAFEGLDRASHSLIRVPVAEWHGMIFVIARPGDDAIDVDGFLGPIAPLLRALDFAGATPVHAGTLAVRANWKLAHDTFCEPYHVPAAHPQTLAPALLPWVAIYDRFGDHQRYASPGAELKDYAGILDEQLPEPYYQGVHSLFPNTTFTVGRLVGIGNREPFIAFYRIFPGTTVGEALAHGSIYLPRGGDPATIADLERAHASIMHVVQNEDFVIAADAWQRLAHAPPDFRLTFGRNEMLLQQNHRRLAELCGMPLGE